MPGDVKTANITFDVVLEHVFGTYDASEGILYSGCPTLRTYVEEAPMRALFRELHGLIRKCPSPPALFVDFENVRFDPRLQTVYREALSALRPVVSVIYRYNVPRDVAGILTSTVIRTANLGVRASGNVYDSRALALHAYLGARGHTKA